jgi:hypothetical protein
MVTIKMGKNKKRTIKTLKDETRNKEGTGLWRKPEIKEKWKVLNLERFFSFPNFLHRNSIRNHSATSLQLITANSNTVLTTGYI